MTGEQPAQSRASRRWVLLVVLALAAGGAWYSAERRSQPEGEWVVLGGGRPLLLDFGMGVCTQCKRMQPVMEQARRELGALLDVHVLDIREEQNEELARQFRMSAMPLIVLVDGSGRELWRQVGFIEYPALSAAVNKQLGPPASLCAPNEARCEP